MTVADLLAASGLRRTEARALLASVLEQRREMLIAFDERSVSAADAGRFERLASRRRASEPLAYVLSEQEFYGRAFVVTPDVLIPRPETELLVEVVLQRMRDTDRPRLLDLGTGSGNIAITLACERPDAQILAVDVSETALKLAQLNAERLGARVEFALGGWFDAVAGEFDAIVANPPYVADGDPHLEELRHEPPEALRAGADGLSCLRPIIAGAPAHLAQGGWLMVEHGHDQATAVRDLFGAAGLTSIASARDLAGIERVTVGTKNH